MDSYIVYVISGSIKLLVDSFWINWLFFDSNFGDWFINVFRIVKYLHIPIYALFDLLMYVLVRTMGDSV